MTPKKLDAVAVAAVRDIIRDLSDRRGLGQEWDQISPEIRREIRQKWRAVIRDAIRSRS